MTTKANPSTRVPVVKWDQVQCYEDVLAYVEHKFPHFLPQLQVAFAKSIEQAVRCPQKVSTEFLESVGYGHKDENHFNYRWNPVDDMLEQQRVAMENLELQKKKKKNKKRNEAKRKMMETQAPRDNEGDKTEEEEEEDQEEERSDDDAGKRVIPQ